jgi:hypothetical protein
MPYIKQERRTALQEVTLEELANEIQSVGEFNYIISYIANGLVFNSALDKAHLSYKNLSAIRAEIQDAADEFYRRVMVPYENSKMQANGDVYTVNS